MRCRSSGGGGGGGRGWVGGLGAGGGDDYARGIRLQALDCLRNKNMM